jgi:hypothetical protein
LALRHRALTDGKAKSLLSELAARYRASAAEMRRSASLIGRINLRSEIFRVAEQLDQLAGRLERATAEAMKGE